jgi:hypothetical protein
MSPFLLRFENCLFPNWMYLTACSLSSASKVSVRVRAGIRISDIGECYRVGLGLTLTLTLNHHPTPTLTWSSTSLHFRDNSYRKDQGLYPS